MVTLREITKDNFWECIGLKVEKGQEHFVAPNAVSLAESKYYPEYVPLAIYDDENMVGFLMHGVDPEDGAPWIIRLMIDRRYQRRGYASAAMEQALAALAGKGDRTLLSLEPENTGAEALYLRLGFRHTGRVEDGEAVMELLNRKAVDPVG